MRISTKGRYALEAMLYMALNQRDACMSVKDIATNTGISESYLEQLFIPLKQSGIVHGTRGALGGYTFGLPPAQITAGMVLRAVEGSLAPVRCVEEGCTSSVVCAAQEVWQDMNHIINSVVDGATLETLCAAMGAQAQTTEFAI